MHRLHTRTSRILLALTLAAATGLAAHAQPADPPEAVKPGKQEGLGLIGPDIPQVLKDAQAFPYTPPAGNACESIYTELAALDQALGPDIDDPKPEGGAGGVVEGAVMTVAKSFIPYRSLVRILTGAGKKEQDLIEAAIAGSARRGYLRGLQANLSCMPSEVAHAVEPPPPVTEVQAAPAAALPAATAPVAPPPRVTETLGPAPMPQTTPASALY